MGYRNKSLVTKDQTISSSSNCESLSDAMLVFTMNIIGLPVDVHVKDGSVFSGIFYTASVDDRFGTLLSLSFVYSNWKLIFYIESLKSLIRLCFFLYNLYSSHD